MRSGRRACLGVVVALIALTAIASACTGSAPQPGPGVTSLGIRAPRILGWVHTDGTRLVQSNGATVRLLSVQVNGMNAGHGLRVSLVPGQVGCEGWKMPDPATYRNIASWGFNAVRLTIAWANIEPAPPTIAPDGSTVHHYNRNYLAALDQIVGGFAAEHVAVVLSMQQNKWTPAFQREKNGIEGACPGTGMPVWLYRGTAITTIRAAKAAFFANQNGVQDWFAAAWREVISRYADQPAVIGADMINEPYAVGTDLPPSALHLDALYERVGAAIREADSHVLLIFEDTQDLGTGVFSVTRPPPFPNVVYSFHLYRSTWNPDGFDVVRDFTSRADRWGVPVWIGEFGMFGGDKNGADLPPDWQQSTVAMFAYCKAHGISWNIFAYSGTFSLVKLGTDQPKPLLIPIIQRGF